MQDIHHKYCQKQLELSELYFITSTSVFYTGTVPLTCGADFLTSRASHSTQRVWLVIHESSPNTVMQNHTPLLFRCL
jgi:hypothetical protein